MQLHLDPVGGAAGDMFIAALLSAFPEHEAAVVASIGKAVPEVDCALVRHNDGVLEGRRFRVDLRQPTHTAHHHPILVKTITTTATITATGSIFGRICSVAAWRQRWLATPSASFPSWPRWRRGCMASVSRR